MYSVKNWRRIGICEMEKALLKKMCSMLYFA